MNLTMLFNEPEMQVKWEDFIIAKDQIIFNTQLIFNIVDPFVYREKIILPKVR